MHREAREYGPASSLATGEPRVPPEPRLQVNPSEDAAEFRAQEDAILNGYTWVNREAGTVQDSDCRGDEDDSAEGPAGPSGGWRSAEVNASVHHVLPSPACPCVVVVPDEAFAQMTGAPAAGYRREPGMAASVVPRPIREIGFDQRLDERVPLDVEFRDDQGRTVRLGEYFGHKPVVLAFVYYDCPMLCTMILSSITSTLGVLSLDAGNGLRARDGRASIRARSPTWPPGRRPNTCIATIDQPRPTDGIS